MQIPGNVLCTLAKILAVLSQRSSSSNVNRTFVQNAIQYHVFLDMLTWSNSSDVNGASLNKLQVM